MQCRLLTGKTPRNGRVGLDGLGSKMTGTDELGKRLRKTKRARVASPQPDSRSQNSATVSNYAWHIIHCSACICQDSASWQPVCCTVNGLCSLVHQACICCCSILLQLCICCVHQRDVIPCQHVTLTTPALSVCEDCFVSVATYVAVLAAAE